MIITSSKCYGIGIYRLVVSICACFFVVAVGEAAWPAYEPFNYAAGIPINGQVGGTGWGGPWMGGVGTLTVTPGLAYPPLTTMGSALGGTQGAVSSRPLAAPVVGATGTTLVLRALIRSNVNGTPATQATLRNSAGGTFIIGDLAQPNQNAGNWGMQNAGGCFYSNHSVAANVTTLLVAQIDFSVGFDRMRLWVDPASPYSYFINPPDIDVTNANLVQFSGVSWQTQPGGQQRLDEIRINTTGSACVPPPNTTMVAWYPFDETGGTTAANLATGNTGVHINNPTPVPAGMVAGALSFNGINNYVQSPSTIVTNFGPANTPAFCLSGSQGSYSTCLGGFSIDAWVRIPPYAPPGVMTILDKRSAVPVLKGYTFFVFQGRLGLQLADGNGTPAFTDFLSNVLTPSIYDGNWHYIAVTVSRSGSILFYHNGLSILPSGNAALRPGSLANTSPLRIGTSTVAQPPAGWFRGVIDELEIFNRVLSNDEVKSIFLAGPFGKCK